FRSSVALDSDCSLVPFGRRKRAGKAGLNRSIVRESMRTASRRQRDRFSFSAAVGAGQMRDLVRVFDGPAGGLTVSEELQLFGLVLGDRGHRLIGVTKAIWIIAHPVTQPGDPNQLSQRPGIFFNEFPSEFRVERPDWFDRRAGAAIMPIFPAHHAAVMGVNSFDIERGIVDIEEPLES